MLDDATLTATSSALPRRSAPPPSAAASPNRPTHVFILTPPPPPASRALRSRQSPCAAESFPARPSASPSRGTRTGAASQCQRQAGSTALPHTHRSGPLSLPCLHTAARSLSSSLTPARLAHTFKPPPSPSFLQPPSPRLQHARATTRSQVPPPPPYPPSFSCRAPAWHSTTDARGSSPPRSRAGTRATSSPPRSPQTGGTWPPQGWTRRWAVQPRVHHCHPRSPIEPSVHESALCSAALLDPDVLHFDPPAPPPSRRRSGLHLGRCPVRLARPTPRRRHPVRPLLVAHGQCSRLPGRRGPARHLEPARACSLPAASRRRRDRRTA